MTTARTIPETFCRQVDRLGPRTAVRYKWHGVWVDVSWNEWRERVDAAALGLIEMGVNPGDRVAILSENRFEWLIADLAILTAGAATVPLHASLGAEQIRRMVADSGATAIIVSNERQAAKIQETTAASRVKGGMLSGIPGETSEALQSHPESMGTRSKRHPGLHAFGVGSQGSPSSRGIPESMPPIVIDGGGWDALEQLGRSSANRDELAARNERLTNSSLASLIYTSGATGPSKGVMLTHGNFLANSASMIPALGGFTQGAVAFNWLPLSHVYARTVDLYVCMMAGVTLALAESPETAVTDLRECQPMHLSSVPRFYEKLLGSVASLPPETRRARLREMFGPRIRWLGCGGAALPPAVADAYRDAGLEVVVGYGMTESSPVIATNGLGANKLGSVGQILPGIEVAIAPDGEILTRGPHVMAGYWNQPDATALAIVDGWLHTGDLGRLDADGYLWITGRKKDLIVLSSGKNVAPTPLEGMLLASPLIEQVVIFGEGRPFLSAVVVPRDPATSPAALLEDVNDLLASVAPWEKVRKIVVTSRAFSVASEELTVSMKLRRPAIYEHYREELEALYD